MKIAERILLSLETSPKTTKEIQLSLPDKSGRCLAATISNYPELFLRLDRGLVGLKNRDEDLVRNTQLVSRYALYKRLVNLLTAGPLELQRIYSLLPEIKRTSIRANICLRKDLFVVAGRRYHRIIGRRGRDEFILERYPYRKKIRKPPQEKPTSVADLLAVVLSTGPKSLLQIYRLLPNIPKKSITCKLSLGKQFVRIGQSLWKLTI